MLLTSINEVKPGMRVGAVVMNPSAPSVNLLKPGAELTETIIQRLRALGVRQLWVEHHLTRDLDEAVNPVLHRVKVEVYNHLKRDMTQLAQRSVTNAQIQTYRKAIVDLVKELVTHRRFVGLADQLLDADAELVSHSSNVAYLATVVGLEIETYLVRERPKVPEHRARNLVTLGLGGMLHDLGKVQLGAEAACHHEIHDDEHARPDQYESHPQVGYDMLRDTEVPATVRHVVLAHHRRFDGTGWPTVSRPGAAGGRTPPTGRRLHIFARIVAAANVLDNLLRDAEGGQRPPVAALHDFAGPRFDGWFDPIVRLAALRRLPPFAVGSQVRLSDGRSAVVVAPNLEQPCRPSVRLLEEPADGEPPATIHLAEHLRLHITTYAGTDVRKWLFTLAEPKPGNDTGRAAAA